MVLNQILVRLGYAPAIIYKRDRTKYLDALQAADAGDPGPLGEMLARAVLDNLYRFIVPAVAGPNRIVPLAGLTTDTLTEGALRVAANRGRLRAQKGPDGQWRSTRAMGRRVRRVTAQATEHGAAIEAPSRRREVARPPLLQRCRTQLRTSASQGPRPRLKWCFVVGGRGFEPLTPSRVKEVLSP